MTRNRTHWFDHTGRSLIRIVIGSYFLAISMGLVKGVDAAALLDTVLPAQLAGRLGAMLLMGASLIFMSGLVLRISALFLALFVLSSSAAQHGFFLQPQDLSGFWRDIALICAVLLSYASHRPGAVRKARWFLIPGKGWITRGRQHPAQNVVPRRVSAPFKPARRTDRPDYSTILRPLIAPAGPIPRPPQAGAGAQDHAGAGATAGALMLPAPEENDEITNIFIGA